MVALPTPSPSRRATNRSTSLKSGFASRSEAMIRSLAGAGSSGRSTAWAAIRTSA